MTVQLKVNMILEKGAYLPMGALVDEEIIPLNLRKKRYIGAPGEAPEIAPMRYEDAQEPEPDEGGDDNAGDPGDDTDDPVPPSPRPAGLKRR